MKDVQVVWLQNKPRLSLVRYQTGVRGVCADVLHFVFSSYDHACGQAFTIWSCLSKGHFSRSLLFCFFAQV